MGQGWEGVTLPAAQGASGSLRTASTKRRGNSSEKIEKLGPAEAGLAQYRAKPSGREIVAMNGTTVIPVPQETCEPLVLTTSTSSLRDIGGSKMPFESGQASPRADRAPFRR
jgi:hypothetical protein